jgi:hypothetical protein
MNNSPRRPKAQTSLQQMLSPLAISAPAVYISILGETSERALNFSEPLAEIDEYKFMCVLSNRRTFIR